MRRTDVSVYYFVLCSELIIKFSVKTCHPYFYNQLYHGADEYGLAGSWLTGDHLLALLSN